MYVCVRFQRAIHAATMFNFFAAALSRSSLAPATGHMHIVRRRRRFSDAMDAFKNAQNFRRQEKVCAVFGERDDF